VADPALGQRSFTHQEFLKKWRSIGVTLDRQELPQQARK